jgi:hypothetical protein
MHSYQKGSKYSFQTQQTGVCYLAELKKYGLMVTGGVGYVRDIARVFCGAYRDIGRRLLKIFRS